MSASSSPEGQTAKPASRDDVCVLAFGFARGAGLDPDLPGVGCSRESFLNAGLAARPESDCDGAAFVASVVAAVLPATRFAVFSAHRFAAGLLPRFLSVDSTGFGGRGLSRMVESLT